jgi:hypothetical protein
MRLKQLTKFKFLGRHLHLKKQGRAPSKPFFTNFISFIVSLVAATAKHLIKNFPHQKQLAATP